MHLASLGVLNNGLGGIVMPVHSSIGKVNYVTNSPMKISLEQHLAQSRLLLNDSKCDKNGGRCLTIGYKTMCLSIS